MCNSDVTYLCSLNYYKKRKKISIEDKYFLSSYFLICMNILAKNFTIDHNSKLPLHVQVEELFRKLIKMEVYKKGALLPKEVDLANLWGVSRNTIRQATNKLEHEGLIIRKKRSRHTCCRKRKSLVTGLDHWYSFTREMQEKGINVINQLLKTEEIQPNEEICNFFSITPDKKNIQAL